MPNLHRLYKAGAGDHRARGRDALSRALAFRRPGRARKRAAPSPARADTGWLNRALAALEPDGRAIRAAAQAFAVGPITPLVVRGPAPVLSWTPPRLPPASDDTLMRLLDLYRHTDPALARVLEERMGLAAIARAGGMDAMPRPSDRRAGRRRRAGARLFRRGGRHGGEIPRAAGRPAHRRARASTAGTPTPTKARVDGRLADAARRARRRHRGDRDRTWATAWRETVVAVVTEFGRTARINGTDGTDHGTATVALLAGGALKGGRVIADWPGLKDADLLREAATSSRPPICAPCSRACCKDHLRVDERALAAKVFPDSADVKPMAGLLA